MRSICHILYLFFPVMLAWLISCSPPEVDYSSIAGEMKVAVETTRDVIILYSDSAELRIRISGPESKRYTRGYSTEEEFPDGVYVEFFNAEGVVNAWLKSDYAIRKEKDKVVIAQRNVVLENISGERIEGEELIWDEREREIYSNRFVKITRGDEVVYGYAFRSDENFTRMEMKAIEGDLRFPQVDD